MGLPPRLRGWATPLVVLPIVVVAGVPAALLWAAPGVLSFSAGPLRWIGAVLVAAGLGLAVWAVDTFGRVGDGTPSPADPPRDLVDEGPFARLRNPMYVAVVSMVAGEALLFGTGLVAAYAGLLVPFFHLMVTRYEEPRLEDRFGERYRSYRRRVPRWGVRLRRPGDD